MNFHELIENIPLKSRPTPQRGEGVITANRGSPAGVMPSVTKAIAEVPPIGRYARWTRPSRNPEALANVGGSTASDYHNGIRASPKPETSVYQGSVRVERMGADTPLIKNKTEETQCRCGLHQETVQTRSTQMDYIGGKVQGL